jgi:transmembrane sensor
VPIGLTELYLPGSDRALPKRLLNDVMEKRGARNAKTMPGGFDQNRQADMPPGRESDEAAQARKEAARWFSLLSSGRATAADAQALKEWCRANPLHAEAYARASRLWDMLGPVTAGVSVGEIKITNEAFLPKSGERRLARRAFLGGALAASFGTAAYLAVRPPLGLWPSLAELRADVHTNTGEQCKIAVAKGVDVELNTRSSFSIQQSAADGHRIELVSGEAFVTADPHSGSACAITAGSGQIFARNAKVDVRYENANVRVVCVDGSVDVKHGGKSVTVTSAEQIVYGPDGMSEVGAADSEAVTAWQRGLLIFRQSPLASVIDEVNRYRHGNIVLLNPALSQHLVDARFRLDHLENVITFLRQAFNAHVVELPAGVVLVS